MNFRNKVCRAVLTQIFPLCVMILMTTVSREVQTPRESIVTVNKQTVSNRNKVSLLTH